MIDSLAPTSKILNNFPLTIYTSAQSHYLRLVIPSLNLVNLRSPDPSGKTSINARIALICGYVLESLKN